MAKFTTVARVSEVPPGQGKQIDIKGELISVWNLNGEFLAIDDICSHEEYYLSDGAMVDGCCVECSAHGAQFDLHTGAALCMPATLPVRTYAVRVVGDEIQVEV